MSILDSIFGTGQQQQRTANWSGTLGDREWFRDEKGRPPRWIEEETAMTYAPVWQAVSLISGDVAKLPLNHYRKQDDRSRSIVNGETQQAVRWKANEWQTAFQFWRLMIAHALLWKSAFAYIAREGNGPDKYGGRITGLYPIYPANISVTHKGNTTDAAKSLTPTSEVYYEYRDGSGVVKRLAYDEVLQIRGIGILPTVGLPLVEYAGSSISIGLAAETFGLQFLNNAARPSGYVRMEGHIKDQTALQRFMTTFRNSYAGAANSGKIPLLEDGAEFKPLSISQDEAQYIETRKAQVQDVARYFNLPPHKLGDDSRVSYNNLEQENQSYLDTCLSHWLNAIVSECFLKLLGETEQVNGREYFEHNTNALLRADINSRATAYRQFREMGVLNADQIAASENLEPIGEADGGDVRYVPASYMKLGESTVKPQPSDPAKKENGGPIENDPPEPARQSVPPLPATGGNDASGPVCRLLEETLRRQSLHLANYAEKASQKYEKYGRFVDGIAITRKTFLYDDLAPIEEISTTLGIVFNRFEIADWFLGHAAEEYDRLPLRRPRLCPPPWLN